MKEETYLKADKLFEERRKLIASLKFLPSDGELCYFGAYSKLVRYDEFGNREIAEHKVNIDKKKFVEELRKDFSEKLKTVEEEIEKL